MSMYADEEKTVSLTEELTSIIRRRIMTGYYTCGEHLKEGAICHELNVSRSPVRRAFKNLVDEQLVEYVKNKGCFVVGFTDNDLRDTYLALGSLCDTLLKLARERITSEEKETLRKKVEIMERTINEDKRFALESKEFAELLCYASHSRIFFNIFNKYVSMFHHYVGEEGKLTNAEKLDSCKKILKMLQGSSEEGNEEMIAKTIRLFGESRFA